mgnify:CR=1 FL=1
MAYQNLLIEDGAGVRRITINRPDKLNALNSATIAELAGAFSAAGADASVRVVVLTGSGQKAFVAGADISEFASLPPADALRFSRAGQQMMRGVERLGKPVIAELNGFALGGGLEIAMSCTLRIAADTAKLGQPEINLGVMPGFGGTQRLHVAVPGGAGDQVEHLHVAGRVVATGVALAPGLAQRTRKGREVGGRKGDGGSRHVSLRPGVQFRAHSSARWGPFAGRRGLPSSGLAHAGAWEASSGSAWQV